jgi:hypothetical protein
MDSSLVISRNPDLLMAQLDDEVALMSIEQGSYFGLKNTSRRIWELLEQPKSVGELLALLTLEYSAPQDQILADVGPFLKKMSDKGLVSIS